MHCVAIALFSPFAFTNSMYYAVPNEIANKLSFLTGNKKKDVLIGST